jgi:transglutaminase-like putative cysteine protease
VNAVADRRLLAACELALVAVTASIVLGFGRLFVDHSFLPEVATMAVVSHVLAIVVRRAGKGIVLSALVSLVSLVITASLLFYAGTTRFGLPTWTTRDAARTDIVDAWHLFGEVRAPAIVHPGFVLVAGTAMWLVAFLADWAAFRLWSPIEAVAPAAIVFLFSSLQRAEEHQAISTAMFAGTVLVFVLLHRLARQDTGASWLATEPAKGRSSIVRVGSAVGALAIITGLVVGPALPGAGEEAVVPWRDIGEGKKDDSRVTVSPLVTIKDRLVNLGSAEAFAVVTSRPDYWRLTSLDRFDGVAWTSSGKYQSADGELPSKLPDGITTTVVQQQFTIEALATLWLPAAYEPQAVLEDGDLDPSYEAESGTLTVGDNRTTADGATYIVQSQIPVRDPAVLQAATAEDLPGDVRDRYTALPDRFSDRVAALAHAITDPQATPFGKAKALQDYFHTGRFTYSLDVANGHGTLAIERFLFETQTGYCEQFAGTYAAMARAVGLPARVAVGFTPGQQDADGVYRVKGENAHAWPEVYLAGSGWVRFEPTPGRGAPGDESYTGQTAQQAPPGGGGTAETIPSPTTAPGTADTTPVDPLAIDPGAIPEFDPGIATSSGTGSGNDGPSVLDLLPLLAVLAGVAVVVLGAIPVAKSVRRHRRHARLRASARGRVDSAWEHAVDALGLLDVPVDRSATPRELARRAATALGSDTAPTLADLAEITTAARFAPDEPDDATQREASGLAGRVSHAVGKRVSWKRRVRRAFDPRPLFPGGETVTPT